MGAYTYTKNGQSEDFKYAVYYISIILPKYAIFKYALLSHSTA